MTDLHAQLLAEVQRRLDIARAAAAGPWSIHTAGTGIRSSTPYAWVLRPDGAPIAERHNGGTVADVEHIALHDPADAVRRYEADLRRLERHVRSEGRPHLIARRNAEPDWRCMRCGIAEIEAAASAACEAQYVCRCGELYPCPEVRDLAASLGVEVTG